MKKGIIAALLALLAALGYGGYQAGQNMGSSGFTDIKPVLSAISATTTSSAIDITGAERVTLSFNVANVTGDGLATSTFAVTASADGKNFVTFNKLVSNVADTNAESLTRGSSIVMDANGTEVYSMDLEHDNFKSFKVTDTILGTTTAIVTVTALIDY
jgi:hypothetical protein